MMMGEEFTMLLSTKEGKKKTTTKKIRNSIHRFKFTLQYYVVFNISSSLVDCVSSLNYHTFHIPSPHCHMFKTNTHVLPVTYFFVFYDSFSSLLSIFSHIAHITAVWCPLELPKQKKKKCSTADYDYNNKAYLLRFMLFLTALSVVSSSIPELRCTWN